MHALERLEAALLTGLQTLPKVRVSGVVREVTPSFYRASGLSVFVKMGDRIGFDVGDRSQVGEVVRVDDTGVTIKPFDGHIDAGVGTPVYRMASMSLCPHPSWKGRVVNALGEAIDDLGTLVPGASAMPIDAVPPPAMTRSRVRKPLRTGVRAIDLFTPLCEGQRIGIFAGSGVGKSTLLSMVARCEGFDTIVVALVGERGREVREFLEGAIAPNRGRSVIVVSTG
ncbi:flagellum-specific ATP synthase FliI, partial [Corallococcus exiguus]|nr:flagellum-specific ATP synthase FliI [Corallococcus exiguus]